MIGWLNGRVLGLLASGALLVDVGGVGYEVQAASSDPVLVDEEVELFIHTVVRDDAIQLYGFRSLEEREFFAALLVTPGVGPSTALGALRTMSVATLAAAIESEDTKTIATIVGIGPKTAARIVLELRGRLSVAEVTGSHATRDVDVAVTSALRTLGYGTIEIRETLRALTLPDREDEALRVALAALRRA